MRTWACLCACMRTWACLCACMRAWVCLCACVRPIAKNSELPLHFCPKEHFPTKQTVPVDFGKKISKSLLGDQTTRALTGSFLLLHNWRYLLKRTNRNRKQRQDRLSNRATHKAWHEGQQSMTRGKPCMARHDKNKQNRGGKVGKAKHDKNANKPRGQQLMSTSDAMTSGL